MIPSKKKGRPSKRPSDLEIATKYETMTARAMAEEYGVSIKTVQSWIMKIRKEAINETKQ